MPDNFSWKDFSNKYVFQSLLSSPWLGLTLTMKPCICGCSASPLLFNMGGLIFFLIKIWGRLICSHKFTELRSSLC